MRFQICDDRTSTLVVNVFRELPKKEQKTIESVIGAVTDHKLITVIRPFMLSGKVIHELYFDPAKLVFFIEQERIGAVLSAFIISSLAQRGALALSDQELMTHPELIIRDARRLKHATEVSAFLRRFTALEDEWQAATPEDLSKNK